MNDMENNDVAFELATLSLKGKRFNEAENAFTRMLTTSQTCEGWCGLGFSKLGLLMEKTTIDEVFYCFDKAVAVSPEKATEVENVLLQAAIDVISNLYTLYINTILAGRKASRQRSIAMITTVVGAFFTIDAINNRSTLGAIASAGFTGLSYDNYLQAGATVEELNALSKRVVKIIEEFKSRTAAFVKTEIANLEKFKGLTAQCEAQVVQELKTEDQKKAEHAEATKVLTGVERQKYIAQKSQELNDETHPFHFQKSEALYLFEEKKYSKALPVINYALSLYSEDIELKRARQKCLDVGTTKDAFIFFIPWLLTVSAATDGFKKEVSFNLIVFTLVFCGIIFYRSKKRSTESSPI